MNGNYRELQQKLRELLALEYNCTPDDFLSDENVLTVSEIKEGRRCYSQEKYFFHMVTMGGNTVITADETLHDLMHSFIRREKSHWLFSVPVLAELNDDLAAYGYKLTQTHHMYLPYRRVETSKDYDVRWFYGEEIHQFYGDERFPNAICAEYLPERPDRIVVCAYDGDRIMGMAGCSEDAPHWQQIGIDVMPEYRSKGVGTYLVTLLKNKIEETGDIPFYGTAMANLHSINIALNCGFRPAWTEIGAEKIK